MDFYHAAQYVADAAKAAFPRDKAQRDQWHTERCHELKHKQGAASRIFKELQELSQRRLSQPIREKLEATITYFSNHKHQMNYAQY